MSTNGLIGRAVKRVEDKRFTTGHGNSTDDIVLPQQTYAAFVRSQYAHAKILSVDTSAALTAPGVVAVYTGKDIANIGPVPCASALPGLKVPDYRVLAQDKVLFVGHPIAAVVATQCGYLIGGLITIELIFNYQGIGQALYRAANDRDYPVLQSAVLIVGVVYLVATLVADILYSVLNPRIRYGSAQ